MSETRFQTNVLNCSHWKATPLHTATLFDLLDHDHNLMTYLYQSRIGQGHSGTVQLKSTRFGTVIVRLYIEVKRGTYIPPIPRPKGLQHFIFLP